MTGEASCSPESRSSSPSAPTSTSSARSRRSARERAARPGTSSSGGSASSPSSPSPRSTAQRSGAGSRSRCTATTGRSPRRPPLRLPGGLPRAYPGLGRHAAHPAARRRRARGEVHRREPAPAEPHARRRGRAFEAGFADACSSRSSSSTSRSRSCSTRSRRARASDGRHADLSDVGRGRAARPARGSTGSCTAPLPRRTARST